MSLPAVIVGEPSQMRDVRRRFEDASIHVEHDFANLAVCLKSLPAQSDYKRMFAVQVSSTQELPLLARAISAHVEHPFVAIIDEPSVDAPRRFGMPDLVHGLMRAGVSQVLTRPLDSHDFSTVLSCINRQFGGAEHAHTLIAVTGATGGGGATTLAVNLAYELTRLTDRQAILTEQEGRVGMLASYLDVTPKHTYADLASMPEWDQNAVQQTLIDCHGGLRVLCGGQNGGEAPLPERLSPVLSTLRSMAPFVVVDVTCTLTPTYFEILSQADHIFIVAEQTLPSMRNLRLLQDSLRPLDKFAATNVVVNKFDPRVSGFSLAGIKDIVATPKVWTVESAASTVNGALNTGRPLRLHAERAPVVEDIAKIARATATAAGYADLKVEKSGGLFGFLRLRA